MWGHTNSIAAQEATGFRPAGPLTEKLILTEKDLSEFGVWGVYDDLRRELYNSSLKADCLIVQAAAFVIRGWAFLLLGVGGIDFLDSLSRLSEVEGIIGNGNALFITPDFRMVYSAHSPAELLRCYELEGTGIQINFVQGAPIAPLVFLVRSFRELSKYEATKQKVSPLLFETQNTFAGAPIRFEGSLRRRLRSKFVATSRVVHCARRPTLELKECLFDSNETIYSAIGHFCGRFSLVYTRWSQVLCDVAGMQNTRMLTNFYNPTDPITPHLVTIAKEALDGSYRATNC